MPSENDRASGQERNLTVRRTVIHAFTLVQLLCLSLLVVVEQTALAISFPFFIAILIPLRLYVLNQLFSQRALEILDPVDNIASSSTRNKERKHAITKLTQAAAATADVDPAANEPSRTRRASLAGILGVVPDASE